MKNIILGALGVFLFLFIFSVYMLYDIDHGGDKRDDEQKRAKAEYDRQYESELWGRET